MNSKSEKICKKDVPFYGYRLLALSGILILAIAVIVLCVYFYIKYKELIFLILTIFICLAGFSHIAGRISVKVVNHVYKKE